jgi:hypothetical protein
MIMAIGGALMLWAYVTQSQWDYLISDVTEGVVEFSEVRFISEWPLSDETLKAAISGADLSLRSFPVSVGKQGLRGSAIPLFKDQAIQGLKTAGVTVGKDLSNVRYAFFLDLPRSRLEHVRNPFLFFYTVWSPYKLYLDGELVRQLDGRSAYIASPQLLPTESETIRVLWVVANKPKDRILGLNFQTGVSVRSEQAMSRSVARLPVQVFFPKLASSLSFMLLGVFALFLAISAQKYLDVWAFSAFCLSMSFYIWAQTPVVYDGFLDRGATLVAIRSVVASISIVSAAVLSMAYFRLEGRHVRLGLGRTFKSFVAGLRFSRPSDALLHPFRMTLLSTVILCVVVISTFWPMSLNENFGLATAAINTRLTYILCASQLLAFFFGFKALFELRAKHKRDGLEAQVSMLNRRIALSIVFAISMLLMLAVYIAGFGTVSLEVGTDFILVAAIFPALAMLLMFFSMVSSGTRFYARFAPRLGQIDHEVMAFGAKALERRYYGSLLVFDVAGMKKLNNLRSHSAAVEQAVDGFVSRIEHDLADVVQRGRVTFRYKSNGDEFIFAMRAKDLQSASALTTELMTIWVRESAKYMNAWRDELVARLETLLPGGAVEARAVAASIELHVLATTLKDMKITIKGGIERPEASPDFLDARFTSLSALFKPTRHNVVAMYRDDAEALIAALPQARFAPSDSQSEMGFVSWLSTADISHPTAA